MLNTPSIRLVTHATSILPYFQYQFIVTAALLSFSISTVCILDITLQQFQGRKAIFLLKYRLISCETFKVKHVVSLFLSSNFNPVYLFRTCYQRKGLTQ